MKITKAKLKQIIKEELAEAEIFRGPSPESRHQPPEYSADPETDRELEVYGLVHRLAVDPRSGEELPHHEKEELSRKIYDLVTDKVGDYFGTDPMESI